jgi:hypothetical protein
MIRENGSLPKEVNRHQNEVEKDKFTLVLRSSHETVEVLFNASNSTILSFSNGSFSLASLTGRTRMRPY